LEDDMKAERDYSPALNARTTWSNGDRGGLYVLLVEDDPGTAESTALFLRECGHRVRVACDGPAACQAAVSQPPDVVLLDLALPGMDGWEVARRLQEPAWEKRPLLIAVTGHDREEAHRRSLHAGIDLHLAKPVDPGFLRQLLARFCRIIMPTRAS
jgi:CheY-like chemotaxis protein